MLKTSSSLRAAWTTRITVFVKSTGQLKFHQARGLQDKGTKMKQLRRNQTTLLSRGDKGIKLSNASGLTNSLTHSLTLTH